MLAEYFAADARDPRDVADVQQEDVHLNDLAKAHSLGAEDPLNVPENLAGLLLGVVAAYQVALVVRRNLARDEHELAGDEPLREVRVEGLVPPTRLDGTELVGYTVSHVSQAAAAVVLPARVRGRGSVPMTGVRWARFSIRSTPGSPVKACNAVDRTDCSPGGQMPTTRP